VYYYNIALPLKPDRLFTYTSEVEITQGCRVLVNLNNQVYTAVIWDKNRAPEKKIKYKSILEIIDQKPLIKKDLLEMAEWINRYYSTSLGISLSAMVPAAFNVQVQLQVKRIVGGNPEDLSAYALQFLNKISADDWVNVSKIKKDTPVKGFYTLLEQLEDKSYLQIKRVFDRKIKYKTVNYIISDKYAEKPSLTEKQQAAYSRIISLGKSIPLASIAGEFSYSVVKSLVKKNLIRIEPKKLIGTKEIFQNLEFKPKKIQLNQEQNYAAEQLKSAVTANKFSPFLLYGITGSGKTEIYIATIKQALDEHKCALMLVPEIALTPQMVNRFYNAFGNSIAVLHSHLNDRERWQQWRDINSGRKKIVIGARSAIFAPLARLGVIIVDEEHGNSYKQETSPRYNARDMAILRARINGCVCILGSATPSLESWLNAKNGKLKLLQLSQRPLTSKLPEVKLVDLRKADMANEIFSKQMLKAIEVRLDNKQQVLLLHNRRGHSSFVQCVSCGKMYQCPQCDISMNYHSTGELLKCHYCGYSSHLPRKCDACGGYIYHFGAPGTQQLEKQLKLIFPQAKILRMDSDTARKKDSYDSMFQRMKNGEVDLLLGTQMISKGLDFENVTLVGVVLADQSLNFPDFRAAEITFQLLTQVAGRSGRGAKQGEVIIQTYNPEHYAIAKALKQDYLSFTERELELREKLFYPPFWKLVRILFAATDINFLKKEMIKINLLRKILNESFRRDQLILLGPVEAPFLKLQKNYRYHLILKCDSIHTMSSVVHYLKKNIKLSNKIKYTIDVDPLSLL
jgi:primosomal protein N' (replication factor Y)